MAASGAYDVLVLVHDFPYRSLPSEVATANEVTRALLDATRERPGILPVYVSLTSGEPPPETKALLDGEGGGAPLLRGALEAFRAIAVARGLGDAGATRPGATGPWRAGWPALAADRTSTGRTRAAARRRPAALPRVALSERESLAFLAAAGIAVTAAIAVADAAAAVAAARQIGRPRGAQARRRRARPQERHRRGSRSGCAATMRSTARRSACSRTAAGTG